MSAARKAVDFIAPLTFMIDSDEERAAAAWLSSAPSPAKAAPFTRHDQVCGARAQRGDTRDRCRVTMARCGDARGRFRDIKMCTFWASQRLSASASSVAVWGHRYENTASPFR